MTLVLFVPHREGFLLVADKQDTHIETLEKYEFRKLHLQTVSGPAIGSSGITPLIQLVYSHLDQTDLIAEKDICKAIQKRIGEGVAQLHEDVEKYGGTHYEPADFRLEMLVLHKGEAFKLFSLSNVIAEPISDLSKMYAVPELNPEAKRYLEIRTTDLTEKEAIALGEEILRQTAFGNFSIGPPEYHGYDVIKVTKEGVFSLNSVDDKKLKKLAPSELVSHISSKTRFSGVKSFWKRTK